MSGLQDGHEVSQADLALSENKEEAQEIPASLVNEKGVSALKDMWQNIASKSYWHDFFSNRREPLSVLIIGTGKRVEEIIALQRFLHKGNICIVDNNEEAISLARGKWHEYTESHPEAREVSVTFTIRDLIKADESAEKADLLVAHNLQPSLIPLIFEGGAARLVNEGGLMVTTLARPIDVGLVDVRYAWRNRQRSDGGHWMVQMEQLDKQQLHGYQPEDTHPLVKAFGVAWSDAALRVFKITPLKGESLYQSISAGLK